MRLLTVGLILGGLASLLCFGILGVGRNGIFNFDGRVLYAAGSTWLQHANPYDHVALSRSVAKVPGMDMETLGFFYPPQSAAICVFLGLLSFNGAQLAWLLINLAAIAALVALSMTIMRQRPTGTGTAADPLGPWIVATVVIGNPFTTHVVWMGQTTLLAIAAVVGAWVFAGRKNWLVAGLFLGLASYKPQVSVLLFLWLILERDWRTLLAGAVTAAAMAFYPMLTQGGPLGALQAWRSGVSSNYALPFNLPSFSHKVGLESFLYAIGGISVSGALIMSASALLTVLLWGFRRRIERDDQLALLMIITLTFSVYLHDYDYVGLIPAFVSLWWCMRMGRGYAAAGALLLIVLFLPQRLLHVFGVPALDQWRVVVVAAMGMLILYANSARRADREPTIRLGNVGTA